MSRNPTAPPWQRPLRFADLCRHRIRCHCVQPHQRAASPRPANQPQVGRLRRHSPTRGPALPRERRRPAGARWRLLPARGGVVSMLRSGGRWPAEAWWQRSSTHFGARLDGCSIRDTARSSYSCGGTQADTGQLPAASRAPCVQARPAGVKRVAVSWLDDVLSCSVCLLGVELMLSEKTAAEGKRVQARAGEASSEQASPSCWR